MKNFSTLFIFLSYTFNISASNIPTGADISFRQDSFMSNKIYLNIKVLSPYFNSSFQTDVMQVSWGDTSFDISLTDTIQTPIQGVYIKEYKTPHVYPMNYMDSIVNVGTALGSRMDFIANIEYGNSDQFPFVVQETINLKALKNKLGYISPTFDTTLYINEDTIGQQIIYDPHLTKYNADTTIVQLINPIDIGNSYHIPNRIFNCSDTLYACSESGILDWNKPCHAGFYVVVYQVSQFSGDTLISIVMRDIMFTIQDSDRTGISDISARSLLRCYPSPSSGTFTIDMSGYDPSERQVYIYDQLGAGSLSDYHHRGGAYR